MSLGFLDKKSFCANNQIEYPVGHYLHPAYFLVILH